MEYRRDYWNTGETIGIQARLVEYRRDYSNIGETLGMQLNAKYI